MSEMNRTEALVGSAAFFVIAPGSVAGLVPWLITHWRFGEGASSGVSIAGGVVIALSLALLIECFARFAIKGSGTPAPIAPTKELVVSGAYARVRNPMYVAVSGLIFGQALLFASAALIAYGVAIWFVLGLLYFAIAGRHKLVLSPEEEFAMTRGEHGHPELEGYGTTHVSETDG